MKIHQLRKPLTEYDEHEDEPQFRDAILTAGTVVYHGTNSIDFDERAEELDPPLWVSQSPSVAEWFARRWGDEGKPRIIAYTISGDQRLLVIEGKNTFDDIEDFYSVRMEDPNEMAEQICRMGYDGWTIPDNYTDGDDIMLCRPALIYDQTAPLT